MDSDRQGEGRGSSGSSSDDLLELLQRLKSSVVDVETNASSYDVLGTTPVEAVKSQDDQGDVNSVICLGPSAEDEGCSALDIIEVNCPDVVVECAKTTQEEVVSNEGISTEKVDKNTSIQIDGEREIERPERYANPTRSIPLAGGSRNRQRVVSNSNLVGAPPPPAPEGGYKLQKHSRWEVVELLKDPVIAVVVLISFLALVIVAATVPFVFSNSASIL